MKLRFTAAAILLLGTVGCSSIDLFSGEMDWQQVGYNDGIKGVTARNYQALSELNESEIAQYQAGYQQGNAEYCNPQFAYQIGLSGQYYEGVCDGLPHGQKFRLEWQRGWSASR